MSVLANSLGYGQNQKHNLQYIFLDGLPQETQDVKFMDQKIVAYLRSSTHTCARARPISTSQLASRTRAHTPALERLG